MKVLHVHEIAYIPKFLAAKLRGKGVEADFREEVDPVAIQEYDIIHGHYALNKKTIKAFRLARKYGKPFVLHCHGSDVRLLTGNGMRPLPFHYRTISRYMRKRSSKVLLSTPDLMSFEPAGEYIPNPVDLETFKPMPDVEKADRILICGKQIKGSRLLDFIEPDKQYDCVNTGYPFVFPKNVRVLEYVKRPGFAPFLNRYSRMIGTIGDVISMARLEAMACGLYTFTDFPVEYTQYYGGHNPDEVEDPRAFVEKYHHPDLQVERLKRIYEELV